MANDKNILSKEDDGRTRVDLGDDLLTEGTVVLERPQSAERITPSPDLIQEFPADGPGSVEDLLQSAKILINEGLVEDAKKILRHILISDPSNAIAQQTLIEIQSLELKRIFDGEEVRRPFGKRTEQGMGEIDAEALMRQLDKDLNLGVFLENSTNAKESVSLFQDSEVIESFCKQLEKDLVNGSVQDWIDLGVAFLEMELYPISIRLFMSASRRLRPDHPEYDELTLSCTCLLALALILAGRPFEAIARIQPIMQDVEIRRENKIELFYLMGRTYEAMKRLDLAFQFYQQVIEIDPYYRDVDQRLRKKRY